MERKAIGLTAKKRDAVRGCHEGRRPNHDVHVHGCAVVLDDRVTVDGATEALCDTVGDEIKRPSPTVEASPRSVRRNAEKKTGVAPAIAKTSAPEDR